LDQKLLAEIFGSIAAIMAVSIYIPQMLKTMKTKRAYDLSMMTIIFMFTCNFFWFLNGVLEGSYSRTLAAIAIMVIAVIMFILKKKYGYEDLSQKKGN